ncbi:hypothetical protein [Parasphingorhabdus cellanae]|uniref:Uncharacterized protein n=1 Tax=Parasphingorhabdus cellanae TaxID=2806553 RepID=A0ABX7T4E0_9SPHN|nr:hypothetical protein [Parasphingorhabdus cellanae]QTD56451.1 hypothetical protein J4G78_02285 [Parasphingorhabdus cellanae]
MTSRRPKGVLKIAAVLPPLMMVAIQPAQARDRNVEITPYLEVQQVLVADLKDGSDVLTYTTVAAGLETSIQTRQAEAQVNLRYERRFFIRTILAMMIF